MTCILKHDKFMFIKNKKIKKENKKKKKRLVYENNYHTFSTRLSHFRAPRGVGREGHIFLFKNSSMIINIFFRANNKGQRSAFLFTLGLQLH